MPNASKPPRLRAAESPFRLNDMLTEVLNTTKLNDPREVAAELLRRIPTQLRVVVLSQILAPWVRDEMSRRRMLPSVGVGSAKVAAVRADWENRLNTPLRVGDGWKRLADCTASDLYRVSTDLRVMASRSLEKAAYYENLAAHVPEGGTVGMLAAEPKELAA